MAWRALTSGKMVEVSGGRQLMANGAVREASNIVVTFQGQVIENDISADMRQRYIDNDPYVRSILEYGEIDHGTDGDGNPTKTFVPKGIDGSAVVDGGSQEAADLQAEVAQLKADAVKAAEDAAKGADESSASIAEREAKVADLEGQVESLKEEIDALDAQASGTLSFDDLSSEALAAEIEKKGIPVVGSGSTGNVLKKDMVKALEEARASH